MKLMVKSDRFVLDDQRSVLRFVLKVRHNNIKMCLFGGKFYSLLISWSSLLLGLTISTSYQSNYSQKLTEPEMNQCLERKAL